jgi:hypothetical protein
MYAVTTIGELPGLKREPWPDIPPGWVPSGTPGLPGVPAPVPGPPRPPPPDTVSAPVLAVVAVGGVLLGALGLWAWGKWM